MDPEVTLYEILRLATLARDAQNQGDEWTDHYRESLTGKLDDLCEWIKNGGFFPDPDFAIRTYNDWLGGGK